MENSMPLVSIIIPVYNGENFMRQAIDSALNQSYSNIEILVINDGSTDKTEEIALSYGDKIRYFKKENGGVSTALNLGIKEMRGEYFSWLSHDDVYTKEKVRCQIDAANAFNDSDAIIYCDTIHIDKNSNQINGVNKKKRFLPNEIIEWENVLESLFRFGAFSGCALLIPKKIFTEFGLSFDESLRYAQDALLWYLMFFNKTHLIYTDKIGVKSRIHSAQLTQRGSDIFKKDALTISNILIPYFEKVNNLELLYYYLKRNVALGNDEVLSNYISNCKIWSKLSILKKNKLRLMKIYGVLRPFIRRMYYRLFRKIKTS